MPVCLAAIVGGNCATIVGDTLWNRKRENNDKAQQWTIEQDGSNNKFAFKSESNGQYLRATAGQAYGHIGSGAKQWWIAEPGVPPGCYWLKCAEYPDAYLCNASGSYASPNKIYCWPKQLNWSHALQWYILDSASGGGVSGLASGGQDSQQAAKATAELEQRTKSIAEREQAMKSKEAELAKRETQASQDEIAAKTKEDAAKAKEEQMKSLQNDLQEREKKLKDMEASIKAKETTMAQSATVAASSSNGQGGSSDDSAKQAALVQENERLKKELAQRGASGFDPANSELLQINEQLKQQLAEKNAPGGDASGGGAADSEMMKENERLKKELAETKSALGQAGKPIARPWVANAVHKPERKVPRIIRPAKTLPRGYDNTLVVRAIWPGARVVEIEE